MIEITYKYKCTECGHKWKSKILYSYVSCPKCYNQGIPNSTTYIYSPNWKPYDPYDPYDPCKECSNDPRNGGSGVCHCTLGIRTTYTY